VKNEELTEGERDMKGKLRRLRHRIYEIIELDRRGDAASAAYDCLMLLTTVASLVPLMFKRTNALFVVINTVCVSLFILDYLMRLLTADLKLGKGPVSFILHPFTFMSIIDLLTILPYFALFSSEFKLLRVLRLIKTFRILRIFRVFKLFRYSKSLYRVAKVVKDQRGPLTAVFAIAAGYVFLSALVVFNVEPGTFENFFEALYWATVSLTTVGYGDIYPVTTAGRAVTMLSSLVGVAIVALPSGIITAGYMDIVKREK